MKPPNIVTNREIQDLQTPISAEAGHHEPPGRWAGFIYELRFNSARRYDYIKTAHLQWLQSRPIIREPVFQMGLNYSAGALFHMLDTQVEKVEAIYMQIVGRVATTPCTACLTHNGPFVTCVKIDGYPNVICCANCHWWEEDERCHVDDSTYFRLAPPPPPPPPPAGSSGSQPSPAPSSYRPTSGTAQSSSQHQREDRNHHRDSSHNSRDHGQRGQHAERDRHGSANRQRHTSQQSNTSDRTPRAPRTLNQRWERFLRQRNEQRSRLLRSLTDLETAFAREVPATSPLTDVFNALLNSIMSFLIDDTEMISELRAAMARIQEQNTDTER
ncbi:hypothetical protein N7488_003797 [Penicillium malachiteum]|nr:hypothetical protein N7488_003797 [Penicillium malachiteum]